MISEALEEAIAEPLDESVSAFPHKIRAGDLIVLGKSKPRQVTFVSDDGSSAGLMPTRKMPGRQLGITGLFYSSKKNRYFLQGSGGKIVGEWPPSEVKVMPGKAR